MGLIGVYIRKLESEEDMVSSTSVKDPRSDYT